MQTIKPLPIVGPVTVSVKVTTGSGEVTKEGPLTTQPFSIGDDYVVATTASRLGVAAYHEIAVKVVAAAGVADPIGNVAAATVRGQDIIIQTAEEIEVELAKAKAQERQIQYRIAVALSSALYRVENVVDDAFYAMQKLVAKLYPKQ